MRTYGEWSWRQLGRTATGHTWVNLYGNGKRGVSEEIREIAWKAQHRLHTRYRKLMARGKEKEKVVTAVGRELLGFYLGHWGESRGRAEEDRTASSIS